MFSNVRVFILRMTRYAEFVPQEAVLLISHDSLSLNTSRSEVKALPDTHNEPCSSPISLPFFDSASVHNLVSGETFLKPSGSYTHCWKANLMFLQASVWRSSASWIPTCFCQMSDKLVPWPGRHQRVKSQTLMKWNNELRQTGSWAQFCQKIIRLEFLRRFIHLQVIRKKNNDIEKL